jgi:aryl-alcohol dehydrogenase
MKIQAAITRYKKASFSIESVDLEAPRADEVLVRVVGAGVCHTDVKMRDGTRPLPYPIVLGHEGAGIVEAVGADVTHVQAGDHVVLTFNSCGRCPNCRQERAAYCQKVIALSFGGQRLDGSTPLHKDNERIAAYFFGQSSFATYALATARNTIKVRKDIPLALLGPLGCGLQTGAGAVLNSLQAKAGSSIAVFGVGSVGLSAVMAAVIAGCDIIIAVDVNEQRLALARELGATHALNAKEVDDVVTAVRQIGSDGVHYSLDTTGSPDVFKQAVNCLKILGICGLIGGTSPGTEVSLEMNHILPGRTVRGIIQGDSVPQRFIPQLIDWYADGRFPFDRLITYYPFADINQACADMAEGKVIKPVLQMG